MSVPQVTLIWVWGIKHAMFKYFTGIVVLSVIAVVGQLFITTVFAREEIPLIPPAKGEQCVADTDLMRREHMDLMKHQRDETVIEGIRGNPYSIVGCVDCHAQKDASGNAIRVDAEGQFCQSCHAFAAVKIDCFGCHAAVPTPRKKTVSLPWSDLYSSLKQQSQTHGQNGSVGKP